MPTTTCRTSAMPSGDCRGRRGRSCGSSTQTLGICTTACRARAIGLPSHVAGAARGLLFRQLRQRSQRAGVTAGARRTRGNATSSCWTPRTTATPPRSSTSVRTSSMARAAAEGARLGPRRAAARCLSRLLHGATTSTPVHATRARSRRSSTDFASAADAIAASSPRLVRASAVRSSFRRATSPRSTGTFARPAVSASPTKCRPASAALGTSFWAFEDQQASCRTSSCSASRSATAIRLARWSRRGRSPHAFDNGMEFFSTFGGEHCLLRRRPRRSRRGPAERAAATRAEGR